jgi:hypothetical protein
MKDYLEIVGGAFITLFLVILATVFLMSPMYFLDRYDCSKFGETSGIRSEYHGLTCYVEYNGKMVPRAYYYGNVLEYRIKE